MSYKVLFRQSFHANKKGYLLYKDKTAAPPTIRISNDITPQILSALSHYLSIRSSNCPLKHNQKMIYIFEVDYCWFSLHRSQLFWHRVAEEMVRSEPSHLLLLWPWERYFLHISSQSIMNHILFEETEVDACLAFCCWQWHCSCCIWTINDAVLISCNQTSSRRGSSVSMATPWRWTAPYGRTQRKTVASKSRLQTSESIRCARLLVMIWVTAVLSVRPNWKTSVDLRCAMFKNLARRVCTCTSLNRYFYKPIHSCDTAAFALAQPDTHI